jgi:hypothetical protein
MTCTWRCGKNVGRARHPTDTVVSVQHCGVGQEARMVAHPRGELLPIAPR